MLNRGGASLAAGVEVMTRGADDVDGASVNGSECLEAAVTGGGAWVDVDQSGPEFEVLDAACDMVVHADSDGGAAIECFGAAVTGGGALVEVDRSCPEFEVLDAACEMVVQADSDRGAATECVAVVEVGSELTVAGACVG